MSTGLLAGLQGAYTYDAMGRPTGHATQWSSTPLTSVFYGYDSVGRWSTVSANGLSAEYHYASNSNLLSGMSLKQGATLRVTHSKTYDDANRLTSTSWSDDDENVLSSHAYTYDGAHRRLRSTLVDGSYWDYAYNSKGEVTGAVKKNAAGTPYPGLQYGYSFDEIGNRVSDSVDAAVSGTRNTTLTSNALNQYTSIGTPNTFDVIGSAASSAIVKVNTETADRLGPYFRKEVTVNNSASAVWKGLNLEFTLPGAGLSGGDIVTQRAGHYYVAPATASPTYDEDGNLTSDSRWTYIWDGENRLVAMETASAAISASVPKRRLEFLYDGQSRRISKKVMDWNATTSAWITKNERRFVYDGWNLVAELNASGNLIQSHTWGMDLSGTAQGAGGVGGLLWSKDVANTQVLFAAYDGNGNVVAMISTSDSEVKARYDYTAFGETVLQEGDGMMVSNSYRFSTKYQDEETGLCYYGYRYYDAACGRWLNRDPIEEQAFRWMNVSFAMLQQSRSGTNLYAFLENNALNVVDYLGLKIHWHHLLPKGIFTDELLEKLGLKGQIDIHSKEYGWMLDEKYHTHKGGVHPLGWNDDWKNWINLKMARKEPIQKCDIDQQIEKMKEKYELQISKGKPATGEYPYKNGYYKNRKAEVKSAKGAGIYMLIGVFSLMQGEADGSNLEKVLSIRSKLEEAVASHEDIAKQSAALEAAQLIAELFGSDVNWTAAALLNELDKLE